MADLVLSSVGRIDLPFIDALSFGRERRHKVDKRFLYVIFGLAMAIPSSIALALVLSSADAVFSNYLGSMLTHIILPTNWFDAIFLFAFFYVASYCGITHFLSLPNQEPVMPSIVNRKANCLLAIAFTAPITALYRQLSADILTSIRTCYPCNAYTAYVWCRMVLIPQAIRSLPIRVSRSKPDLCGILLLPCGLLYCFL